MSLQFAGANDAATATNIVAGLVTAGVTDNLDWYLYVKRQHTWFKRDLSNPMPPLMKLNFALMGGNGEISSNLTLSNLTDTGNDAVLLLNNQGNTVTSSASITSAVVNDSGFFGPGAPSASLLNQQNR